MAPMWMEIQWVMVMVIPMEFVLVTMWMEMGLVLVMGQMMDKVLDQWLVLHLVLVLDI